MDQPILPNRDDELRASILTVFETDSSLSSDKLRVGVLNNIVHLAGTVESLEKRKTAEDIAKQVPGVRGVVNRIESPDAPSPARTVNLNLKNKKRLI